MPPLRPSEPRAGVPGPLGPPGPPAVGLAAFLALFILAVAVTHGPPPGSLDDVFVVLSEARGDGAGGATSLLDVGVKAAALAWLPSVDPLQAVGWAGLLALALAVLVTVAVVSIAARSALAGGLVGAGLALSPGLVESAAYLLEGPWFALALCALAAAAWRGPLAAVVLCGTVLAGVRPEGALVAALVVGWRSRVEAWSWPRTAALAAVAPLASMLARLAVQGRALPLTFRAKRSDSSWSEVVDGASYLWAWVAAPSGLAIVVLAACAGAVGLARPAPPGRRGSARAFAALAVAYAGIVILSGGDGYAGGRLAFPVAVIAWWAAAAAWPAAPRLVGAVACGAVFACAWAGVDGIRRAPWRVVPDAMRALAAGPPSLTAFAGDERTFGLIAEALDGQVFAHRHAQRARWFAPELSVLDLTGLTEPEVARTPAPGSVRFGRDAVDLALERRVGAIHLDHARARAESLASVSLPEALADARFVGKPYVDPALAQELVHEYLPASLYVHELRAHFNLLVRHDMRASFERVGFRFPVVVNQESTHPDRGSTPRRASIPR